MDKNFTMADLKTMLQARQHKMTPQRQIVLQVFLDNPDEHLSAEDVHDLLKESHSEIGLATIYRSLELLCDLSVLSKIEFGDGCARYELTNTEPNGHHHHHIICVKCGKVIEFKDDLLEPLENAIENEFDFKIINHQVKFFGECKECYERAKN
ncbi:MAG: transcriptional repressor [Selenomonadaceae bacterium]|nr:transcriptional repressor [Selenomonadaceae bacterium]